MGVLHDLDRRQGALNRWLDVLPQDELVPDDGRTADVRRRLLFLMSDGRTAAQGDVQMSFSPWRR